MARERSPNRDKAKELYLSANGEVKLTDIAAQLNVSDSQIRKWKSTDKWDLELNGALPKGNSNVTNKNGEVKLTDIAAQLNVSDSQIRKWKSTDKWDLELNGALPKGNSNVTNKKGTKTQRTKEKKEPIAKEVEEVIGNDSTYRILKSGSGRARTNGI